MKRLTAILTILLTPIILFAQDTVDDQYMVAYVVIADTSQDYYDLRDKMLGLADKLQLDIDTMGRGYNKAKDLICLPDDHEDDIYAGDYFPRRYPTETLSLEYLNYYTDGNKPTGGTIALVVTITDKQEVAEATLARVKEHMSNAYIVKASIYMGCMH